jgi:hypothetical protein
MLCVKLSCILMAQFGKQEDRRNKSLMAKVYGMHVPMKMEMEQVMDS